MTAQEINRQKTQRILDDAGLLKQLRANIASGSHSVEDALSEVLDAEQREQLRISLTN